MKKQDKQTRCFRKKIDNNFVEKLFEKRYDKTGFLKSDTLRKPCKT